MSQPTKQREGDQPLPTPGRECVQDALIAEIEQRKQLGIQRYGQPLMTHNGRDAIRDAREEAVDLAVYLMQIELEVRDLRAERDRLAAGVPLICADERHEATVQGLKADLRAAHLRERQLTTVLDEVLRSFVHKVHPGYAGLQSQMEPVDVVERWRAVLANRQETPGV